MGRPIAPPASAQSASAQSAIAQSAIAQTAKSASGSATRFTSTRSRAVQLAAGSSAKDWTLILDYHKGAHSLELSPPSSAKAAGIGVSERPLQRLRITEHSKVFELELCAHPRACAPLAACPSFQASCARASEAEARGGTGAPLPFGKGFGRFRRGKGVAPPPPSLGSLMGMGRAEIERRSRARWAGRHRASTQISIAHAWASLSRRRDGHGMV